MSGKYWIKLYHEILRDRKMFALDDHLYRRVIEMFLMAGENDKEGYLPCLDDIAFTLRDNTEEIETDLNELIRIGILEFRDGYYFVAKFKERQDAMPKAEFNRRRRDKNKLLQYDQPDYQPVTNSNAYSNTDKIRIDTDTDKIRNDEIDDIRELSSIIEKHTGMINGNISPQEYISVIKELVISGATEPDIISSKEFMLSKGRTIYNIKSLLNPIKVSVSKRNNPPAETGDKVFDEDRQKWVIK